MCGVCGLVGKSKHPNVSFQIATKLFERSETRGSDAAGFWGLQSGETGAVLYHKEPRKSTLVAQGDAWQRGKGLGLDLLIMHARQSSQGMGDAGQNKNNHPFVNHDRSIGLVHNGRIFEYSTLKKRYHVQSDCDSEVLLRIFEVARANAEDLLPDTPPEVARGVAGIQEIFSYVNEGHMAVALGERLEGGRRNLWLFHNKRRPLWVADCREALGQIFFFSTPEIWRDAVRESPQAMALIGGRKHKVVELPDEEVWFFSIDAANPYAYEGGYRRFRIKGEESYTPWKDDGPEYEVPARTHQIEVICELGENDEVPGQRLLNIENKTKRPGKRHRREARYWQRERARRNPKVAWQTGPTRYDDEDPPVTEYNDTPDEDIDVEEAEAEGMWTPGRIGVVPVERHIGRHLTEVAVGYDDSADYAQFDVQRLQKQVASIKQGAADIEVQLLNMAQEGSITSQGFYDSLESLECVLTDLQGSMHMICNG